MFKPQPVVVHVFGPSQGHVIACSLSVFTHELLESGVQ